MEEEEGGLGGLLRLYWGLEGWEEDGIEVPWLMVLLKNYLYLLVFVDMILDLLTYRLRWPTAHFLFFVLMCNMRAI